MAGLGIRDQVHNQLEDLEGTMEWGSGRIDCDNVILCGMGGSAISGIVAADCFMEASSVPIKVVKGFTIPPWAGPRTVAVVSSYSGNTRETLSMYEAAFRQGCSIIAITSGGTLGRWAERDGFPVGKVPAGIQPRQSLGYTIGYISSILRMCGCGDIGGDVRRSLPGLREYRAVLESPDGPAGRIAEALKASVPVFVSSGPMQAVAFRWKTQFNENSKKVAFCATEGELCGCMRSRPEGSYSIVHVGDDPGVRERVRGFAESIGAGFVDVPAGGSCVFESMFRMILLGDYASIGVAESLGLEPEPVIPIRDLKGKLASIIPPGGEERRWAAEAGSPNLCR